MKDSLNSHGIPKDYINHMIDKKEIEAIGKFKYDNEIIVIYKNEDDLYYHAMNDEEIPSIIPLNLVKF